MASKDFHGSSGYLYSYLQGAPSQWAAQRIREANGSKFDAIRAAKEGRPVYFTGEVCFILALCLYNRVTP